MIKYIHRFTLYAIIIYLTCGTFNPAVAATRPFGGNGTHFCGVIDGQLNKQHSEQFPNRHYARTFAANVNVGEPRTVRMIYFTPNDWQYRADVVQKMKDTIRTVQTFYAEQMEAHGYEPVTFRFETDSQGEPMVHHVVGEHSFSHYDNTLGTAVSYELEETYDFNANIYFIVLGTDALRQGDGVPALGVGHRFTKNGGWLVVPNEFSWDLVAHELGHTFGLNHDFRDGEYIMSYGPGRSQLSACAAEFLSVHPYFNPDTPIQEGPLPTIELISPRTYPPGATSVPVRVQVNDSNGLHQVLLHAVGALQLCRNLTGKKDAIVEFEYDGGFGLEEFTDFSSAVAHTIRADIVDTDGNVSDILINLTPSSPGHIGTFEAHSRQVRSVSFLHDSATLASVGTTDLGPGTRSILPTIKLWNVATQANIATFGHHEAGISLAPSPDGATLASGSWQTIGLWDVATRANIATLEGHTDWVHSVAFSIDRKTLASGSQDDTVKLWDVATQEDIATFQHIGVVFSVAFSPDGAILASGSEDRTVKLWDVTTEQNIATFQHTGAVFSVAFSPDGAILASGSGDGKVKLWDVTTKQNITTLPHTAGITSVAFSRDGILASGTTAGLVKLWDVATRTDFVSLGHPGAVVSVAFSPDGTTLAAGTGFRAGTIELWDMSELIELRLEGVSEIDIPDFNLRAAIAEEIGLPPSAPIWPGEIENLTYLDAKNANISDLTGLEDATNLRFLDLGAEYVEAENRLINSNSVSDLSPLTGLTKLRSLYLGNNDISDVSALAGLTNLRMLELWNNGISDISALAGLTNLRTLELWNNGISDISALAGLTNLRTLKLWNNDISDISALAGLTNLRTLSLSGNGISDVSPLLKLSLIGTELDSTGLTLWNNPLSYASINSHIPAMQAKGIDVKFYNQAHPALLKISGDNQNGTSFVPLSQPFVVEAQDENGSALTGISVTFAVTRGGGTLSTTNTITDENGRAQSTLILGPNLGTNTVKVSASGIETTATFYAIADSELPPMAADVNNDGNVNVLDLVLIASSLGQSGQNDADVNRDGVVSILDLVLAAGMFDEVAAAPSAQPQLPETLTAVEVQGWLTGARSLEVKDSIMKKGIVVLEQLLVSLTPTETELLANYPNPFNPETWIPYRLAEDAFVTLTIYDGSGQVVRTLDVGHRIAAAYESQAKVIHWNGKNELGEQVASGVYFYTLTAGDYSATRKMLILK